MDCTYFTLTRNGWITLSNDFGNLYACFTWIINTWHQTLNLPLWRIKWVFLFAFLLLFILRGHFMLIQILDSIATSLKRKKKSSNFGIIWDLLRSYQDSTVSSYIPFTHLPLVCTSYRTTVHLTEEINIRRVCYWTASFIWNLSIFSLIACFCCSIQPRLLHCI